MLGEQLGGRPAHSTGRAGDDCHLVFQECHAQAFRRGGGRDDAKLRPMTDPRREQIIARIRAIPRASSRPTGTSNPGHRGSWARSSPPTKRMTCPGTGSSGLTAAWPRAPASNSFCAGRECPSRAGGLTSRRRRLPRDLLY